MRRPTAVTVHAEGVHGLPLRVAELVGEPAAELVTARAGVLPDVRILLTTPARMATRAVAAQVRLAGAAASPDAVVREMRAFTRLAANRAGLCVASPDGGALVLLNGRWARKPSVLAVTLLHELTHAAQITRPGVLSRMTAHLRRVYGLVPADPCEEEAHALLVAADEEEAYAMESYGHLLLRVLPPHLGGPGAPQRQDDPGPS